MGKSQVILVIDDETTILEVTKSVLVARGYQVLTAENGLQGVALFKEHEEQIGLVITDAGMPGLDGIGVIRAIRDSKPDVPILLTSGSEGDTETRRRLDPINVKCLRKPYGVSQLLSIVEKELNS
jgi:CheY-like chemotaxis protein